LSDATSGARYEDLKNLVCEIQIRTVMQDAWAIIDHHLVYKNEASVPTKFKRRLNTISGMFENIDEQFDRMRIEREAYVKEISEQTQKVEVFHQQEINFETVNAYLKETFPSLPFAASSEHISRVINSISACGFKILADLELVLRRTKKARQALSGESPAKFAVAELARAVALCLPEYRKTGWNAERIKQFQKFEYLVERS
jgi:hypothetical protein